MLISTAASHWDLGSLLALLREGLFYASVATLWLIIIQWDLLDSWLGGPGEPLPCTLEADWKDAASCVYIIQSLRAVSMWVT